VVLQRCGIAVPRLHASSTAAFGARTSLAEGGTAIRLDTRARIIRAAARIHLAAQQSLSALPRTIGGAHPLLAVEAAIAPINLQRVRIIRAEPQTRTIARVNRSALRRETSGAKALREAIRPGTARIRLPHAPITPAVLRILARAILSPSAPHPALEGSGAEAIAPTRARCANRAIIIIMAVMIQRPARLRAENGARTRLRPGADRVIPVVLRAGART